jgi:hypothetical protein
MEEYFIYWKDVYVGGYRRGVSHASKDGGKTACGRKMKMDWDGGYDSIEKYKPECKLCKRALGNYI